jgi:hypothetical protein
VSHYFKLSRVYLVLLALFTAGRWYAGNLAHAPYEKVTDKLSIVILSLISSLFYGAFCRRWQGFRVSQALLMGAVIGLCGQVVVFASTLVSYAAGIDSYFTNPVALNSAVAVPFVEAMVRRAVGLLVNTLTNTIAGGLGWAIGGVLPASRS